MPPATTDQAVAHIRVYRVGEEVPLPEVSDTPMAFAVDDASRSAPGGHPSAASTRTTSAARRMATA
jgi:hypothetical protein